MKYPKIQTLFLREDPSKGRKSYVIEGKYAKPEFATIKYWWVTEKLDGTNTRFIISKDKYPFSKDLNDAIERNIRNGYFEFNDEFLIITGRGTDEFNKFNNFESYKKREKYIDAACSTSVLIPYKETIKALLNDPNIIQASQIDNQDWIAYSNNKLREITKALGAPAGELLLPAISWIEHILNNGLKE